MKMVAGIGTWIALWIHRYRERIRWDDRWLREHYVQRLELTREIQDLEARVRVQEARRRAIRGRKPDD